MQSLLFPSCTSNLQRQRWGVCYRFALIPLSRLYLFSLLRLSVLDGSSVSLIFRCWFDLSLPQCALNPRTHILCLFLSIIWSHFLKVSFIFFRFNCIVVREGGLYDTDSIRWALPCGLVHGHFFGKHVMCLEILAWRYCILDHRKSLKRIPPPKSALYIPVL